MTFQAVIILTCNFCFVFVSFLACEQALQFMASKANRERTRGQRPLALESLLAGYFFLCHCATVLPGAGGFLRLFSRLKRRKDETKKRAAEREKVI